MNIHIKELYKISKQPYLLLALIDHRRIYLCNTSCYNYANMASISFFEKLLKSIDIKKCFTEYLLEKNNFDDQLDDITKIISLINCNKCKDLYDIFINKKKFELYLNNEKDKKYLKEFFDIINACLNAYENNYFNIQNVCKYIKKIILENNMILYGHSIYDDFDNNGEIYVSGTDIYDIKNIISGIYFPIFKVSIISCNTKISLTLHSDNETKIIIHFNEQVNIHIFRYETIGIKTNENNQIFTCSLKGDSVAIVNDIKNEYLRKELSFVMNPFDMIKYNLIGYIYNTSNRMENMLKNGWNFNGIIPFVYADIIYYNISKNEYKNILSDVFNYDISYIIIDYMDIPKQYIQLTNSINPIFYIEDTNYGCEEK